MTVHDRKVVVVILSADKAAGVLAEGPDLILKRQRIPDQLGLVEDAVDFLHDFVPYLDAHADVNGARLVCDFVARAQLFKPFRASSSGRHDNVGAVKHLLLAAVRDDNALADAVLNHEVLDVGIEKDIDAVVLKPQLDASVQNLRAFRSEMPDRTVDKLQARTNRAAADFLYLLGLADTLDMRVGAELEIDGIRIIDQRLRFLRADQVRQISADLTA